MSCRNTRGLFYYKLSGHVKHGLYLIYVLFLVRRFYRLRQSLHSLLYCTRTLYFISKFLPDARVHVFTLLFPAHTNTIECHKATAA
jgi:hypothetical protein